MNFNGTTRHSSVKQKLQPFTLTKRIMNKQFLAPCNLSTFMSPQDDVKTCDFSYKSHNLVEKVIRFTYHWATSSTLGHVADNPITLKNPTGGLSNALRWILACLSAAIRYLVIKPSRTDPLSSWSKWISSTQTSPTLLQEYKIAYAIGQRHSTIHQSCA